MSKLSPKCLRLLPLALACFAIAAIAQVTPPRPEDRRNGNSAAENVSALNLNTTGADNTAHGWFSLFSNTDGDSNTANGSYALYSNTTGSYNTANGVLALYSNTIGIQNTANGVDALYSNTEGMNNTANGVLALASNTTGNNNTANGLFALASNTTGNYNTANGYQALYSSTTGDNNTANGAGALSFNTTGNGNIGLGVFAGGAVSTADNVTCIGPGVGADVSNTTWIRNIYGVTTQSGTTAPVVVSDGGQLGTVASSERFKKDIVGMEKASEAILSLRPVIFHYKMDTKGIPQFGLVAEEVAKVNPVLVLPDKEGKPYTVRYDAVNAMLLNEFLKEHRKVAKLEATITQLKAELQATASRQQKQIEALTAAPQKVRAQLELSKPAPQTVLNNQ